MKSIIAAVALLVFSGSSVADSPVPSETPLTATFVGACTPDGNKLALAVITYASGKIIRVSTEDMHGFKNAHAILVYGSQALDKWTLILPCAKFEKRAGSESI